jgi:hypothetical protein
MSHPTNGKMCLQPRAAFKKLLTPETLLMSASNMGTLNRIDIPSDSQR